jgi:hypothetical protein
MAGGSRPTPLFPLPCHWFVEQQVNTSRSSPSRWFGVDWIQGLGWASLGLEVGSTISHAEGLHRPSNYLRTHAAAIRSHYSTVGWEAVHATVGWCIGASPDPTRVPPTSLHHLQVPHGFCTLIKGCWAMGKTSQSEATLLYWWSSLRRSSVASLDWEVELE